jgi:hypothetical protein
MCTVWKGFLVVLFAAVLVLSVMYSMQHNELRVVGSELEEQRQELDRITSGHNMIVLRYIGRWIS